MKNYLSILMITLFIGSAGYAQTGEEIFLQSCFSCHTIGGGLRVGPDLKEIEKRRSIEWIEKFILSSEKLIASGDQDAIDNFEQFNKIKMQDFDFNPEQLSELINYIILAGGGEIPAPEVVEIEIDPEEKKLHVLRGADLFQGKEKFSNGGLACFACHSVSYENVIHGGSLGTDLTASFSKYNGIAGLQGYIQTPSSVIMEVEYSKNPLSPEEITSLAYFLEETKVSGVQEFDLATLFIWGMIISGVLILLILGIWSERKKKSVNSKILNRQIKVKIS